MTCTFCGSILEDDEIECPFCGHKTGVADVKEESDPSEEFEQRFESDRSANAAVRAEEKSGGEPSGKTESRISGKKKGSSPKLNLSKLNAMKDKIASDVSSRKNSGKNQAAPKQTRGISGIEKINPFFISLVGFAACAILTLICLISVGNVNRKIEDVNQSILSQVYQLQNSNGKITERLDSLEKNAPAAKTILVDPSSSSSIEVTKEPTGTATYLGRGGADDVSQNVPIFTVTAKGKNLSFTWQKYDEASGSWVDLVFDAESNNETYGLHIYTDLGKGYTELSAHGVTSAAYGSYRSRITDDSGSVYSDIVELTQRDKA